MSEIVFKKWKKIDQRLRIEVDVSLVDTGSVGEKIPFIIIHALII